MATIIPVPILGTQGFTTDAASKFDTLLAHFFLSDYNQTQLYPDRVVSLARLIELHGPDIQDLVRDMQDRLQTYFKNYYLDAIVEVSAPDDEANPSNKIDLKMTIQISEPNGVGSTYDRLLQTSNSKMSKIIALNN